MDVLGEIHEYSTAEFLARADDFSLSTFAQYIEQARLAIIGTGSALDEGTIARIQNHRLLLEDKDEQFLYSRPDLAPQFASSDAHQLTMTTSPKNLDYFVEHGIDYAFDSAKQNDALKVAATANGMAMQALMRKKILSLSGFDGVSINFIFHDALDHAWLFNFMRHNDLDRKYSDFIVSTGNPFKGHLMSRESELLSGIGFTSRRFLSDEAYYGVFAMPPQNLITLLQAKNFDKDKRVDEAASFILDDETTAAWAGFVVKATLSNLILQRERWGSVKKLDLSEDGSYTPTGEIISLTDPRYLALIIDTVRLLAEHKEEYINQELALNDTVEMITRKFLDTGEAVGSIAIGRNVTMPEAHSAKQFGLSTNHFANS